MAERRTHDHASSETCTLRSRLYTLNSFAYNDTYRVCGSLSGSSFSFCSATCVSSIGFSAVNGVQESFSRSVKLRTALINTPPDLVNRSVHRRASLKHKAHGSGGPIPCMTSNSPSKSPTLRALGGAYDASEIKTSPSDAIAVLFNRAGSVVLPSKKTEAIHLMPYVYPSWKNPFL